MNYYIFNVYSEKKHSYIYTVVFDYLNDNSYDSLITELKSFYTSNYRTSHIIFLTPTTNSQADKLRQILKSQIIDHVVAFYDSQGNVRYEKTITLEFSIDDIRRQGLLQIFKNNMGVLICDNSFHYVLPSGTHSPYFVRFGNMLNNFSEVNFIGYCLLKYFSTAEETIYYDTSSVLTVILSAINLRHLLDEKKSFTIINFGSYDRMTETEFIANSLVIISASSTGNLQNQLTNLESTLEFITLIFSGKDDSRVTNLLNVYNHELICGSEQYSKYEKCKLCEDNSIPVYISGEQFLTSSPTINSILITKYSSPDWLKNFMDQFSFKGVIKCNFEELNSGKKREIFIDLSSLHNKLEDKVEEDIQNMDSYTAEFLKKVKNNIPFSLEYIIYINDRASKAMADAIYACVYKEIKQLRKPISHTELEKISSENRSTALIVACSISTGNKLNAISKVLRNHKQLSLLYFIGILRTKNERDSKNLINNLRFRNDKISQNDVQYLMNIFIPDRHSKHSSDLNKSPWELELRYLTNINGDLRNEFSEIIDNRINILNENGIESKLFWYNPFKDKIQLKLNKNFAFYCFEDCYEFQEKNIAPTQSEVYFVISAILHNQRCAIFEHNSTNQSKKIRPLVQHQYLRSVLVPENFMRFNDGIIQASILRAAKPAELNYSFDAQLSYEMKELLITLFSNSMDISSEAILEFLYAIWTDKLKLIYNDKREFIEFVKNEYSKYDEIKFFVKLIDIDGNQ